MLCNLETRSGLSKQRSPPIAPSGGRVFLITSSPSEVAASSLPRSTLPFAASIRHGSKQASLRSDVRLPVLTLLDVPQGSKFGANNPRMTTTRLRSKEVIQIDI